MTDLRITAKPADTFRCDFILDRPVVDGLRRFSSAGDAEGSPLAERLFAIEGVTEVVVSGPAITVTKDSNVPWQVAGPLVGQAIRAAFASGVPPVATRSGPSEADDALYEQVAQVFASRINPMVAGHGGRVDLIDVQDRVVMLRLAGGCQGCGMADVTLRQGIESTLRQMLPAVQGIVDVTDHASGANPYFASSKK